MSHYSVNTLLMMSVSVKCNHIRTLADERSCLSVTQLFRQIPYAFTSVAIIILLCIRMSDMFAPVFSDERVSVWGQTVCDLFCTGF